MTAVPRTRTKIRGRRCRPIGQPSRSTSSITSVIATCATPLPTCSACAKVGPRGIRTGASQGGRLPRCSVYSSSVGATTTTTGHDEGIRGSRSGIDESPTTASSTVEIAVVTCTARPHRRRPTGSDPLSDRLRPRLAQPRPPEEGSRLPPPPDAPIAVMV